MSNEEFERKMDFIVKEQAQSAVRIGRLEEIVTRLADASLNRFDDIDEKIAALVDSQLSHAKKFEEVDEKIAMLVDAQIRMDENLKRTDESLRNLIKVVDRYFREGRNEKAVD